jgi:hypothetical protein
LIGRLARDHSPAPADLGSTSEVMPGYPVIASWQKGPGPANAQSGFSSSKRRISTRTCSAILGRPPPAGSATASRGGTGAMPADDGFGDDQDLGPMRPATAEGNPKDPTLRSNLGRGRLRLSTGAAAVRPEFRGAVSVRLRRKAPSAARQERIDSMSRNRSSLT